MEKVTLQRMRLRSEFQGHIVWLPFKWFQHLLQYAFNTNCSTKCLVRLNRSSNIDENVKNVESVLKPGLSKNL